MFFLSLWTGLGQAQSLHLKTNIDSTFIPLVIQQFLAERNLLPSDGWQVVKSIRDLNQTLKEEKQKKQWQKLTNTPKTNLSLENYFVKGHNALVSETEEQLYSSINAKTNWQIGGIPLQLGGNFVMKDGKFNSQLSTFSIKFDADNFQQQLKEKYLPTPSYHSLFDKWDNPLDLTEAEQEALVKEVKFEFYRRIINSKPFLAYKLEVQQRLDSLREKTDSTILVLQDSLNIQKWTDEAQQLKKIEKAYQQLWAFKTQINNHTQLKNIQAKANNLKIQIEKQHTPKKLKKELLKKMPLATKEKLLLWTKNFDVGLFHIRDSEFTTHNTALKGIRYGWAGTKIYGDIAYGSQALSSGFLPSINHSFFSRYLGRRFFFLRGGVGSREGNFTQISLMRVQDFGQDSVFTLPKSNFVMGLSGQLTIANNVDLLTEVAVSDYDLEQTYVLFDFETEIATKDKTAFSIKGAFQIQDNLSLKIGYFSIGSQYRSLGNPFLLRGRQGLSLDLTSELWRNKLFWNTSLRYGFSIHQEAVQNFKDMQLSTELVFKLSKQNTLVARYLPSYYLQNGFAEVTSNNNIYSVQANLFGKIARSQFVSVINITNLKTDFHFSDSLSANELVYLYAQKMLMVGQHQTVDLMVSIGSPNFSFQVIQDFLNQISYQIRWKQLTLGGGIQLLKQQWHPYLQYGGLLKLNLKIFQSCSFNLNLNYRNAINQQQYPSTYQLLVNAALRLSIQARQN